jgi:putative FmdB family regulatory protein
VPTYQYACTACGDRLEAVQAFSDAPLTECPACAGRLRKVFSAVGVVFKGSGFYKTDSRAGATKESPAAAKASPDSSPSSTAPAGGGSGSSGTSGTASTSSTSSSTPAAKSA